MKIVKGENLVINGIVVLIYGEPGIGKTSTGLNVSNPLIFDFDGGVQRSEFKVGKDIVRISSWSEIDEDLKNLESMLKNYDNIIIDTIDNCLSYIRNFLEDQDQKLKRNQLQMYGKMKDTFDNFLNRIKRLGKNIILIAHSTTEEVNGLIRTTPKITGGSKDIVKSISDFIGYMFSENNKRTLDFNPTDYWLGKNSAQFPRLAIPDYNLEYNWFQIKLDEMRNKLTHKSEEQQKSLETLKSFIGAIDSADNLHTLELIKERTKDLKNGLKLQVENLILEKNDILLLPTYIDTITSFDKPEQFNSLMENLKEYKFKADLWNTIKMRAEGELNFKFNPKTKKFEVNNA